MLESEFKKKLKRAIRKRLLPLDIEIVESNNKRSDPDLIILGPKKWAELEVKRSEHSSHQPNQDIRVSRLNDMSYASFVYPENIEEVLNDLERLFKS